MAIKSLYCILTSNEEQTMALKTSLEKSLNKTLNRVISSTLSPDNIAKAVRLAKSEERKSVVFIQDCYSFTGVEELTRFSHTLTQFRQGIVFNAVEETNEHLDAFQTAMKLNFYNDGSLRTFSLRLALGFAEGESNKPLNPAVFFERFPFAVTVDDVQTLNTYEEVLDRYCKVNIGELVSGVFVSNEETTFKLVNGVPTTSEITNPALAEEYINIFNRISNQDMIVRLNGFIMENVQ